MGISRLLEGYARANGRSQRGWPDNSGHNERVLAGDEVEVWFGGTNPDKKRRGFHTDGSGPKVNFRACHATNITSWRHN